MATLNRGRRDAIKRIAVSATAGAGLISASAFVAAAQSYSRSREPHAAAGLVFDRLQMQALAILGDWIIPETDTKGAYAADAHGLVDHLLHQCYASVDQALARLCVDAFHRELDAVASRDAGVLGEVGSFRQYALMNALESGQTPFDAQTRQGYLELKSLVVFAYFTSKIGATRALRYIAYPGKFVASISLDENARADYR
ncbi:MAG: gluconate 2-dehydrogenase subunit 3 family protein [Pseudomonadota bacterium]